MPLDVDRPHENVPISGIVLGALHAVVVAARLPAVAQDHADRPVQHELLPHNPIADVVPLGPSSMQIVVGILATWPAC